MGPLGLGAAGKGQKYLCSHLNVNQVWLERGSRDTEEGSSNKAEQVLNVSRVPCSGVGGRRESK